MLAVEDHGLAMGGATESVCGRLRRLAVIGTGALGSELCRLLIDARVQDVLLIDPDVLEPRNVALSPLFRSMGPVRLTGKAALICNLARTAGLRWKALPQEIADVGLGELAGRDLLISCTDSALARVQTTWTARTLRLPMLDGAVQSHGLPEGRVAFYPADLEAGCYLCARGESRRAELLTYALSPALGCAPEPEFPPMSAAPFAIEQVAARLFAVLSADTLPETATAWKITLDGDDKAIALPRSPSCPWHDLPAPETLVGALPGESFADILVREGGSAGAVLELPWPVCIRARCRQCGTECEPFRRTALVRRSLVCADCRQAGALEPLASVAALTAAQDLARGTPAQLGLPSTHLYWIRKAVAIMQAMAGAEGQDKGR